jgi:hypothetical protein
MSTIIETYLSVVNLGPAGPINLVPMDGIRTLFSYPPYNDDHCLLALWPPQPAYLR